MMERVGSRLMATYRGWKLRRLARKGIISKETIKRYLPVSPVIVEAGAHVGFDTLEMSTLWPQASIHAFEPIPSIYAQLVANTRDRANITCHPLALGATTGHASMFVSTGGSDGSSSLLRPAEHLVDHPDVKFESEIEVETVTIDDWARRAGIARIDFLWLDLQGYELAALAAGSDLLREVSVIHTEVNLKTTYEKAPHYSELRFWLEQRNFRVVKEAVPWADGGNVLFVRNR